MMAGWIGFICGAVIGVPFGMIFLSLAIAAKRVDVSIDKTFSNVVPPRLPRS